MGNEASLSSFLILNTFSSFVFLSYQKSFINCYFNTFSLKNQRFLKNYVENGIILLHFDIKTITIIQMEMTKERKQIEEWTGLKYSEIIFDSKKDNWNVF